jgi:hypothetical protein
MLGTMPTEHEERRSGVERRAEARGTEDRRRGPGRPAIPEEERQRTVHVKLPPDLHDALCRLALREGIAVNAVLRSLVERAVTRSHTFE